MNRETIRFQRVAHRASKNQPCPECGKKIRRTRTFDQTINPYNTGADGQPKTRAQILAELRERASEWQQQADRCTPCAENAQETAA